jgi:NAD(P)-dependent dehydrogenase (short-subunit alcohol dehydrogenase family)
MGDKLQGKNAVVTGGGRGIGREVALAMAAEGARVMVVDPGVERDGSGKDTSAADGVVKEIEQQGGTAAPAYDSVADFAGAERIIINCVERFGSLDIVFNAAGVLRERMIFNMTEDDWDTVISVHLKGTFNMCRHACVVMRKQKSGRIINVTSDAWRGTVGQCNYGAAKGGIVSLTRAIAREMGRSGVTCNSIAPLAATRMTMTEEVQAGFKRRLEAGIITRERYEELLDMPGPEYVPPAALFLASDAAANINGQVIGIGGGQISIYSEPLPVRVLSKDYKKQGRWTLDELIALAPNILLTGYVNPAPRQVD